MDALRRGIKDRLEAVKDRVADAARRVGRDPTAVRIVVVTKGHPVEVVSAAIDAGATILGENYAEEGVAKMVSIPGHDALRWHMIGHVQGRKARLVAEHYSMIQSVDSLHIARRLDVAAGRTGRRVPVLLEFNVGGEEAKMGWPARSESHWPELEAEVAAILAMENLEVRGLMAVPPEAHHAEESRAHFRRLLGLREFLGQRFPAVSWSELSIGTSQDFEVAVEEGATMVRIGTAILGARSVALEAR